MMQDVVEGVVEKVKEGPDGATTWASCKTQV